MCINLRFPYENMRIPTVTRSTTECSALTPSLHMLNTYVAECCGSVESMVQRFGSPEVVIIPVFLRFKTLRWMVDYWFYKTISIRRLPEPKRNMVIPRATMNRRERAWDWLIPFKINCLHIAVEENGRNNGKRKTMYCIWTLFLIAKALFYNPCVIFGKFNLSIFLN